MLKDMKIEKRKVWESENVLVGELIFKEGKKTKKKKFVELKRKVVLIVPVEGNSVYLLKEHRPLLGKTVWRIPAGTIHANESPVKGAKRELLEEAGLLANRMTLLRNYEYMGWVKFPIYIFKAERLKKMKQELGFYEKIDLVKVSKKKAKKIALNEMEEPHHAFAILKCLG